MLRSRRPTGSTNLNPRLVVISVAAGDANNRPDKETLDALADRSVLRTDINGWIDVATDGKQMWVTVQRKTPEPAATLTPDALATETSIPEAVTTSTPEAIATATP